MTFVHHNWNWFAEVEGPTGRTRSLGPYQTNFLVIDEHCGTHFDAPSIGRAHDPVPVHQEGLSRGIRYVEVLTNLGELPERGAYFVFLPLKIAGSSGGPGRAIALLPG
jgi:kynurenine formamidase